MTTNSSPIRTTRPKPGWLFYLGWIVLTILSMVLAWFVGYMILRVIVQVVGGTIIVGGQRHITEDFLGLYVWLPVLGVLTGLVQYSLLRRYLPHMGLWIAATFLGWLLFLGVLYLSRPAQVSLPPLLGAFLGFFLIGGPMALPQWLFLRRRIRHATGWLLASAIGWGVALALTDGAISSYEEALSIVLLPAIAGSIAWWLLLARQSPLDSGGADSSGSTVPQPPASLSVE